MGPVATRARASTPTAANAWQLPHTTPGACKDTHARNPHPPTLVSGSETARATPMRHPNLKACHAALRQGVSGQRRLAWRYTGQTDGCAGDIWMRSRWADVNQNGQRRGAGLHAHHVLPPIRCGAHTGTGCGANGCAAEPLQRTLDRVLAWGPGWSHGRAALSPIHKPPIVTPAAAQLPREWPCCPAAHDCTWHAIQPGQLCRQACRHVPPSATTGWPPGPPTGTQRLPAGACGLCCTCLTGYLARALPHPMTHPDVTSARVEEHNVTTRTSAVGQVPAGPRAGGPRLPPSQAWGPRHTPTRAPQPSCGSYVLQAAGRLNASGLPSCTTTVLACTSLTVEFKDQGGIPSGGLGCPTTRHGATAVTDPAPWTQCPPITPLSATLGMLPAPPHPTRPSHACTAVC